MQYAEAKAGDTCVVNWECSVYIYFYIRFNSVLMPTCR